MSKKDATNVANETATTKENAVSTSKKLKDIKDSVSSVAKTRFDGGLGSILINRLSKEEEDRLIEKVEKIGTKAYSLVAKSENLSYALNKPDVPGFVKTETGFVENNTFTPERVKLLSDMHKHNDLLTAAFDKAFGEGSEKDFDDLDRVCKDAEKVINAVQEHLNSKKNK